MNLMSVTYVGWHTRQKRYKKSRMTLTVFFFKSGKKSNDRALISIKMLLFLETIMASCVNVPAKLPGSVLSYYDKDYQGHQLEKNRIKYLFLSQLSTLIVKNYTIYTFICFLVTYK